MILYNNNRSINKNNRSIKTLANFHVFKENLLPFLHIRINYFYFTALNYLIMIKKIEHIGIAMKNLNEIRVYEKLFGKSAYKIETVETENVNVAFFRLGESKIELLEPTNENSAIFKYIQKRGEGIHHIAFNVDDIEYEMNRLKQEGFEFIYNKPKRGADNMLINFIHPKYTNGVLIELCQEIKLPTNS